VTAPGSRRRARSSSLASLAASGQGWGDVVAAAPGALLGQVLGAAEADVGETGHSGGMEGKEDL